MTKVTSYNCRFFFFIFPTIYCVWWAKTPCCEIRD